MKPIQFDQYKKIWNVSVITNEIEEKIGTKWYVSPGISFPRLAIEHKAKTKANSIMGSFN